MTGNITDNYLTKAIAMHVSLFTNVGKSQISETETHFNIERVPVTVDGAVMNGIRYPADENEKGMDTIKDRVVTLSHPTTANGEGVDAYAGESLQKFFSGGYITDKYRNNGVWYVNISIKKSVLKAQDGGEDFYNMLENKEAIGVSTGLYTSISGNAGKTADGKEYRGDATNQQYNHLAMLPNSEPPAGGEATFMRFNSESDQHMMLNLADYMPDSTPQEEKPSVEVEVEQKTDEVESFFTKLLAMLGAAGLMKSNKEPQTHEENAMSIDNMVKALKEANAYKDGMSDDEVKNAYGKMMDKEDEKPKGNSESESALLDAVNALTAKVDSLESQLNAKEQAEKAALVAEVNELDTGIEEADLQNMSVNSLQALKDKHQPVTFGVNGQFRQVDNGSDELYADVN